MQTVVLFAGRTQSLVKQMANRITHGRIGRRFGKWVGKRGTIGLGRTVSRKRVGKRGTIGFGQTVGTDGLDRRFGQTVWADGGHKSVRRGEKQRTVRQAEFERNGKRNSDGIGRNRAETEWQAEFGRNRAETDRERVWRTERAI